MTAHLIDGAAVARDLKSSLAVRRHDGVGLATILVGDDYGSKAYEARLRRLAGELGVPYFPQVLPATATQSELSTVVSGLNAREDVSGILLLRPLPRHIDEAALFRVIAPEKDIEAVHPENAGLLALGVPRFVPSTAASVFQLLDTWLDEAGEDRADFYHHAQIVVVGRSNNVGKPCVCLGYARQAAVASVDEWASRTGALQRHTRRADVLIVAAGRAGLITAEHVKPGAIVLDVGINPVTDERGRVRMTGDVDFSSVAEVARAITPVPGGVGPVTDVWLLRNTVLAAEAPRLEEVS
ncbi:bifunctional 5,10-methylene-tetrahydrofolate dehydrogenase/5,10-methylene-tetrahydrofolate cyclohydrolase [Amycolatopsis acidicola]|uniref:Bifunctional protein FolD n=1 Tax=Amycolatopsis acidicola TaxID=2596893 RepID=A0A5N0VK98_9PSEU|nr:tetrahydrofolate dehydrogenase/cyclohydrolase catalytic domain-containing protein [Amycolatopsis acidicola]KAA9166128.1 bifunctional 5,10-methylene-tetrahydrofolate dehydrogenase/5,10-methylene-tetrahydrofolate cyclohydrolase [Amycolatopsis acidicola]